MPQRGAGGETATMPDRGGASKRRETAPRGIARYGDASGRSKSASKAGSRKGTGFSFSSEGLALIGLRRRDPRRPLPFSPTARGGG